MNTFTEYDQYDGLGLAHLIQAKEVSIQEVVQAAIEQIERLNPRINAVIHTMYSEAQAATQNLPEGGAFRGVPFLVKDLLACVAGTPTGSGNRLMRQFPEPADSELVRRFRNAGLVIVGKTNAPEFGIVPYTEPETYGPTRNPWDPARSPGGSSGGSGAAVAARMTPMASGGDGGGSIRIPASCCGLFGLKPTRGRVPIGPFIGESWRGFVSEGVLTRSVRDSAALLDAVGGSDVGAPYAAPSQVRPFLEEVRSSPGRLRIAFTDKPFMGKTVHPDCQQALKTTVSLLEGLGHELHEDAFDLDGEAFGVDFLTILAAEIRTDVENSARLAGHAPRPKDYEPGTYALSLIGKSMGASSYAAAAQRLQKAARKIGMFFEKYDVLVTPTLAEPPIQIGALQSPASEVMLMKVIGGMNAGWLLNAIGILKPIAAKVYAYMPYTAPFNVTGQPAVSIPLYWNEAGLPIGVQFAGKFGDEATLFRLAGQLESAQPWAGRMPPLR